MKIGDKITMFFHAAGVTSEEVCEVVEFTENRVSIDDYNSDNECRVFSRLSGVCINDNNSFGASRTIDRCV